MSKALKLFAFICLAHLSEHITQAIQVYGLGMPLHQARGLLGYVWPWFVHSEVLHYSYALVMLLGLWLLRGEFSGKARTFWMAAFSIQMWHHFEHLLLLGQALSGHNFFGAPQPISVIQFSGFFNGSAQSGFGGLLTMSHFGVCTCKGAVAGTVHTWTPLMLFVRRVEVHLLYNFAVTVPMVMAMVRQFYKPRIRGEKGFNLNYAPTI
jgi:hypothetical protein